jgi:hypothetical protein
LVVLDWAERFSLYARAEDRARYVAALRMAGLE